MQSQSTRVRKVAVIGGGITGLAAAHRLVELDPTIELTLFEAGDRLGGVLETIHRDGFLIEGGADNFITTVPWALDLCRRIGFEARLVQTNSGYRHAFVVRRGKLHHIPDGFVVMAPSKVWPLLTTPILSPWGKLRLAWERFVPRRVQTEDESLAAFCQRRLGRETYERLVQPLVGGIYTGDPHKLSLRSTMPRFADMEQQHGSLISAIQSQPKSKERSSGARYSMFVAPRDGMSSLIDALAARLPVDSIRLGTSIRALAHDKNGWQVLLDGSDSEPLAYDAIILATPAPATARLVAPLDDQLSAELDDIHHASCSIISLGYRRDQIAHPLDGFGLVVPLIERRKILSASFSSIKYPGRAPADRLLIRVFIGGDCQPELAGLPDNQLLATARQELGELLGIQGEPLLQHISRRSTSMPQYHVGHASKVERIRDRLRRYPGLHVAGNAFDGVGVPNCIHSGEQAAQQVVASLRDAPVPVSERL